MSDEPTATSDQFHLDAWADTGEGYYFHPARWVLCCLFCEYTAHGMTQSEAAAKYRREHEQPIFDRDDERDKLAKEMSR